jgi:putative nucleotidyltransferase with HDIG domain
MREAVGTAVSGGLSTGAAPKLSASRGRRGAVGETLVTPAPLQPRAGRADTSGMDAQLDLPPAAGAGPAAARAPAAPPAPAPASTANGPRLAELLGGLSRALDLAEGQPAGHALRSCWIGQQLGRAIGLNGAQMRDLYYATLLKDGGGSAEAARLSALLRADDRAFKRARRRAGTTPAGLLRLALRHGGAGPRLLPRLGALVQAVRHGEDIEAELAEARSAGGARLARQLRLGDAVADAIHALDEHWDGSGRPRGLAGDEIPPCARIARLAAAIEVRHAGAGPQAAREEIARRRGRRFDPRLADAFAALARDAAFWGGLAADDVEDRVLELDPAHRGPPVDEDTLDDVAEAFGRVVDAKSPWTAGHSLRVALVADQVAGELGLDAALRRWLRRGALLHDIGKLGVPNTLLDKPGPLTAAERSLMQRHAHHTEDILGRISAFGVLARVAGAHHERLDGSGYPRGLDARHIRLETRILAAADRFVTLTTDRPGRPALPTARALAAMREGVGLRVDADCLGALERVLAATGAT